MLRPDNESKPNLLVWWPEDLYLNVTFCRTQHYESIIKCSDLDVDVPKLIGYVLGVPVHAT